MTKRIIAISVIFICSCIAWLILTIVVDQRTLEKTYSGAGAVGQLWGNEHSQNAPQVTAQWKTTSRKEVRETKSGWEYVEDSEESPESNSSAQAVEKDHPQTIVIERPDVTHELVSRKHVSEAAPNISKKSRNRKSDPQQRRTFEVTEWKHTAAISLAGTEANVALDVDYRKRGLLWFSTYRVDFDASYTVINPFDHPVDVTMTFGFPSSSAIYDNMAVTTPGNDNVHVRAENGQMVSSFRLPAGQT